MQQSEIENLRVQLKDSEESATRFIKERDGLAAQVKQLKRELEEARAFNPTSRHYQARIELLEDEARIKALKMDVMRMEMTVLRQTVRLLKKKKELEQA